MLGCSSGRRVRSTLASPMAFEDAFGPQLGLVAVVLGTGKPKALGVVGGRPSLLLL